MIEKSFDIKRDLEIIKDGGFFCQACVVGKDDQSPDPRYCQGCYGLLLQETKLAPGKASWKPVKPRRRSSVLSSHVPLPVGGSGCDTTQQGTKQGASRVTARIRDLASRGLSSRTIEKELLKDNIIVSYRTIARRMKL